MFCTQGFHSLQAGLNKWGFCMQPFAPQFLMGQCQILSQSYA